MFALEVDPHDGYGGLFIGAGDEHHLEGRSNDPVRYLAEALQPTSFCRLLVMDD